MLLKRKGTIIEDKYIIWSNENLDLEDWRADLEAEYPGYSESELYQVMYDINDSYLEDAWYQLNIQLSQPILVIAELYLWNGNFLGYKEIESGNIRDCLYSENDFATWYVDKYGNFRCDDTHHDGTNHYLYRGYKNNISDFQKSRLKEKIYDRTVTAMDISKFTRRLGDDIGKVYGWSFPKHFNKRRN